MYIGCVYLILSILFLGPTIFDTSDYDHFHLIYHIEMKYWKRMINKMKGVGLPFYKYC